MLDLGICWNDYRGSNGERRIRIIRVRVIDALGLDHMSDIE